MLWANDGSWQWWKFYLYGKVNCNYVQNPTLHLMQKFEMLLCALFLKRGVIESWKKLECCSTFYVSAHTNDSKTQKRVFFAIINFICIYGKSTFVTTVITCCLAAWHKRICWKTFLEFLPYPSTLYYVHIFLCERLLAFLTTVPEGN